MTVLYEISLDILLIFYLEESLVSIAKINYLDTAVWIQVVFYTVHFTFMKFDSLVDCLQVLIQFFFHF
jgi:hypothetical protein